jgi:two-component system, OmpR family, sensor histidine kinase KdpD
MTESVVTLAEVNVPQLQEVQARRRHLTVLLLLVFAFSVAGLALFWFTSERFLDKPVPAALSSGAFQLGFVTLALLFTLYIFLRERSLSRLERALIEERVLSAALSNRLHELSALSRAGRAAAAVLPLDDVLNAIVQSVQELLGATEVSIMLFDPESEELHLAASVGLDELATKGSPGLGEGVAGWVLEHRQPVVMHGPVTDPRFRDFVPKHREVRSAMSAPLVAAGEPVGVLNVSVSDGRRMYTPHDLRAMTVCAEHAAIAIANARLYELEKESAASMAELDLKRRDFLATMTHDMKTPLTSILGYVKLLRSAHDRPEEEVKKFTEVVERQGRRLLGMIEQILVATRLEEAAPTLARQALDLRHIVEEEVAAFRGVLGGRNIGVQMPDEVPTTYGDPTAVEHIVANLLDNAVKYSPDGAGIQVAVEPAPGEVRVSVTDSGPGIPEEDLTRVFERYHRASESDVGGSVGLGLFIVRNLTQAHGGRVWAENASSGGARITFTLPLRSEA